MSTEYSSVAGIGIEVNTCFFENYPNVKLDKEYYVSDSDLEGEDYDPSYDYDIDWYEVFEDLTTKSKHINFKSADNNYDYKYYYLFAKDPINGLDIFVEELNNLGIEATREDLKFVSEVDVC